MKQLAHSARSTLVASPDLEALLGGGIQDPVDSKLARQEVVELRVACAIAIARPAHRSDLRSSQFRHRGAGRRFPQLGLKLMLLVAGCMCIRALPVASGNCWCGAQRSASGSGSVMVAVMVGHGGHMCTGKLATLGAPAAG